jgi:hypothetical protein
MRLINKVKEACARNGGGAVVLFCDEAQRYDENEYEWLRDVHDHLDRLQIRLFTFLVGQQELLAVKTALQRAKKTQIVARLMVEELAFFGMRNVRDVATSLHGYDQTCFPRTSDWSFTRFYLPHAVAGGYHLVDDAPVLWEASARMHHKHALCGPLEIPMESFTRAVEIVLKDSYLRDTRGYQPDAAMWDLAVRSSGYIQARQAVSNTLTAPGIAFLYGCRTGLRCCPRRTSWPRWRTLVRMRSCANCWPARVAPMRSVGCARTSSGL